ncbi:ROK family protein [uncultured Thomasclavelia sp.]|uniref:ROK family protein n=1 Tax=uncultured Thomasclavelia sp. TaxID=3025759 RepID=UPI0025E7BA75|nr:ROK family protein [uncultured Thomasclavelia sp.]
MGKQKFIFIKIEDSLIVEFKILSKKDDSVKFYLHFELKEEEHAKQLYNEMIETLIGLKEEKTLQVLLSCSAGLTTSMFAENLNSVAEMLGLDYHFNAVSYLSIYEEVEKYDVVLIAPQIGYMLKRLQENLPEKLVLQIPTAIFAAYDALEALKFVQAEVEKFYASKQEVKTKKKKEGSHCVQYEKRILSIVISVNRAQTRIYYRLNDKCEIIDSNLIIKQTMNIYDLYDIIDTVLLKHQYIDVIGIATPGMIRGDNQLRSSTNEQNIDLKKDFEDKYGIEVFAYNNANAAAVGFALEHPEYKNIVFHSQPFGYGVGGQGIILDNKLITGKNGIAGEVRYFIHRMQFSDDIQKLAWNEQGVLELVTKSLLPVVCTVGPEAIAVFSPLTPDMDEIKNKLNSFIPAEFMPEFYCVKEISSYLLDGTTKLCVEDIKKDKVETSN